MSYKVVKYGDFRKRRNYSSIRNTYELSDLLDNLELNGYISTYNKINDKNNIPSTLGCIWIFYSSSSIKSSLETGFASAAIFSSVLSIWV